MEVGGGSFAARWQEEHNPAIFCTRNPCSFGNAAFQRGETFGFSTCYSAAPAPVLVPRGAEAMSDPLQFLLKGWGLSVVWLMLGLDRSC